MAKIGSIGLGVMENPMAGHDLTVLTAPPKKPPAEGFEDLP